MNTTSIRPFLVMDIVRDAAKYDDTIHFEIGQPDLPPSPAVKDAMQRAIFDNRYGYTESMGLIALREKIAEHYHARYGVAVSPSRILITPGTSGAFIIAYTLAASAGILGLTDPTYPCYHNTAQLLGIRTHFFPVDKSTHYQLMPAALAGAPINALQISSPANPTGSIYRPDTLKALNDTCQAQNITFISDELYHGLDYETPCASALQYNENAIIINGFSKTYCMPGARLGWMIVPEHLARQAEILAQNLYLSAPAISQYGALHAFDAEHTAACKAEFQRRRGTLYHALKDTFTLEYLPEGAFYLWADISAHSTDSLHFAQTMLREIHVAAAPGIDFGSNNTSRYLRLAYTRNIAHLEEGADRIRRWLG